MANATLAHSLFAASRDRARAVRSGRWVQYGRPAINRRKPWASEDSSTRVPATIPDEAGCKMNSRFEQGDPVFEGAGPTLKLLERQR